MPARAAEAVSVGVEDPAPYVWGKLRHQTTVRFDDPSWALLIRFCTLERIDPAEGMRRLFLLAIKGATDEAEEVARIRREARRGRGG